MNAFEIMQYMTENDIHAIEISVQEDNNNAVVLHQFLDDGRVLQTVTEQSVFTDKEKQTEDQKQEKQKEDTARK